MKYIRQKENKSWQCRIYNEKSKFSFTSYDLDEVIEHRNSELGCDPDEEHREARILLIDIETAPILAYVWGIWNVNIGINQIKDDWYILCFSYKWLNENKVHTVRLCDYDGYKSGNDNEEFLVYDLYRLLDEADVVVAHNAVKFDVARIKAKMFEYNLSKPSPFKVHDTLKVAKEFAITSRKLDYIAKFIGREGKMENEGMPLWISCMNGDIDSWNTMRQYVARDILELEGVYLATRGWGRGMPNVSMFYSGNEARCISCGSENIEPLSSSAMTNVQSYPAYRCQDCGQVMRDRKNNTPKEKIILAGIS